MEMVAAVERLLGEREQEAGRERNERLAWEKRLE